MNELKSYKMKWVDGKCIRLHRYVMEVHLGRKLLPTEIVHHKDGNIWNNNLENLEITNRSIHIKIHRYELYKPPSGEIIKCSKCGDSRYYTSSAINRLADKNNYKCKKCYTKYRKYPQRRPSAL